MSQKTRLIGLGLGTLGLLASLWPWLRQLWHLSRTNDLYSHVFMLPAVLALLVYLEPRNRQLDWKTSIPSASVAGALAISTWLSIRAIDTSALSAAVLVLLLGFLALSFLFLGRDFVWENAFGYAILLFMIPMPAQLEEPINSFLQHTSGEAAYHLIDLIGIPVYREGLSLQIPGITLEVAPQCSGIRSSLVLLVTSLIAAKLFLRSPWRRALLISIVIPLAIARNAIRIATLAYLCAQGGPEMIRSDLHTRGGPLFFALSLIPLFALMFLLWRAENKSKPSPSAPEATDQP